jgi:predicted DNA-binding transcriptional regulator AlpA
MWSTRKETEMEATHLNQIELAVRWRVSHRTLERWRWTGEGPRFVKLGGRVVYRLSDIEEYEQAMIRSSTPANGRLQGTVRNSVRGSMMMKRSESSHGYRKGTTGRASCWS